MIPLLGSFMAKVFEGEDTLFRRLLAPIENFIYTIGGVNPAEEMGWKKYLKELLLFNLVGFFALFFILRLQYYLPLNPQNSLGVDSLLAFNITISFVTNTNWQSYSPETTLSYFSQMAGLTVQNFLSASVGICALLALIRGIRRKHRDTVGNFWADLVRTIVYILLPLAILLACALASQGVVQSFSPYKEITTLEGGKQIIPFGPAASQIAIKQLGTNGGGFFGANSSHPFENPTPLSGFLELLAILLIPAALVYAYGIMLDSKKHAHLLLWVMFTFWIVGLVIAKFSEQIPNPVLNGIPSLEGKEARFGTGDSILWAISTTATANGSVNSMLSSLSPLAGGVVLFNIMLGEVIFGGVGVGLANMVMFVLLTVFLSGLMVGRTPEYLGKKIETKDIQWVMLALLTPCALILIGTGLACMLPEALKSRGNEGPHGLSEILYAFASSAGNNGSGFNGLDANTPFYNITLGIVMLLGRLAILVPSIALAGNLAAKKITPPSLGTFSVSGFLFAILLFGVILIVGALTFFPALSLGPIVEHILMQKGYTF
jgi:potassium-transporting ATPase potassium-binding subunit